MMDVPPWDVPLTPAAIKRLAPRDRGRRATASLERKVEAIEREANRPDCHSRRSDIPTDRAKLRRWESVEERFWPWSDPTFDSPGGRNAELMERFAAALGRLRSRGRRRKSAPMDELRNAESRIVALVRQVADLIGQNRELRLLLHRASKGG